VYNRASNSFAGLGGNISYAAIGNLVTSDAGDEVLASNSAGNLYLNNGGWTYTNGSVPVLPGLGLGHLDPGLPPNQDLAYVIGAGNIVYQSQTNWSAANGGSTAYVFLPRVPSAGSPILVTGNRGFGDILVADINNDGLEELVLRKAGGDTNALYVFKNGDPGFSLAAAPDPASNYAGGKPAISGSGAYNGVPFDQGSFPASRVTDGKFGDNSADSFWLGSDGQPNQYITIDLEAQVPIELIGLRNTHNAQYNDRGTKSFRIWASNQVDAGNQLVSPVLILDSQLQAFTGPAGDRRIPAQLFTSGNGLTPGAYRYIRFETHDDSAFGNGNVGLNEIYVSGVRNMALGEPIVKADVYGAGFDAERVTDGKVIDSFQDSYWLGPEGNANASFTLDLGVSRDIKSLAFRNTHNANFNDRGTRQFAVYGSNQIDGSSNLVNPQLVLQGALTTSRGTAGDPWVPVDVFNLQTGVNGGRYRYLRFDALNASFNNSNVGLGEIQVFEDLLPANVAAGKPVTASSWLNNDFRPENITDLRIDDFRNNAGDVWDNNRNGTFASYWLAPDGATDQWLQIDLGHLYRIDRIDLQNTHNGRYNDRATRDFRLEASEDGVNFWPVMTGTLADVRDPAGVGPTSPDIPLESFSAANGDFHRFAAQYLRFTAENFYGTGAGLNEIYAFSGVPEPGTIVLLGVGLAGLALAARRRWRVRRAGQE